MEVSKILQGNVSADLNCQTGNMTDQVRKIDVQFSPPFTNPPIVHGSISNFDHCTTSYPPGKAPELNNFRLRYNIDNISTTGCQITISTWDNSSIWNASVDWIAFGN